jgi:putative addiction module component (TIGR02574 family)
MSMTVSQILDAAQALPPQERENLCTQIAESLDAPLTAEEQACADVAEQRAEELRSSKGKGVPADEVFAKARRRLGLVAPLDSSNRAVSLDR